MDKLLRKIEEDKYNKKIKELSSNIEILSKRLMNVNQEMDTAIYSKKKAISLRDNILEEIKIKKDKIKDLNDIVKAKQIDSKMAINALVVNENNTDKRIKEKNKYVENLDKLIVDRKIKANGLNSESKEYDKIKLLNNNLIKENSILLAENKKINRKSQIVNEDIKKIVDELKDEEIKIKENFRSVQEYETKVLFYYERMRKWYEDKGLKLPDNLIYK